MHSPHTETAATHVCLQQFDSDLQKVAELLHLGMDVANFSIAAKAEQCGRPPADAVSLNCRGPTTCVLACREKQLLDHEVSLVFKRFNVRDLQELYALNRPEAMDALAKVCSSGSDMQLNNIGAQLQVRGLLAVSGLGCPSLHQQLSSLPRSVPCAHGMLYPPMRSSCSRCR
jgi:hypothetical protein